MTDTRLNPTVRRNSAASVPRPRRGFTLVEIMVVLIIIGILSAIAVPAINYAITQGRNAAMKMEVTSLAQAAEQYQLKYGDYPPDGSSWSVIQRHMRKAFPRMAEPDNTLLMKLTHAGSQFSPVAMDRAEALVFFLGGFSSDPAHPLTGAGGPLERIPTAAKMSSVVQDYQYNATRDNAFFEFDTTRLTIELTDSNRYVSTDEKRYSLVDLLHGGADLLPTYLVDGGETPIVYFDSRTYGNLGGPYDKSGSFNGYWLGGQYGGVRPYKTVAAAQAPQATPTYFSPDAAFNAFDFQNKDSFQIISPGRDNKYGTIVDTSMNPSQPDPAAAPVHFVTETGQAVVPDPNAKLPPGLVWKGLEGYQETGANSGITENGHLDNITNFSGTTLEGDVEE